MPPKISVAPQPSTAVPLKYDSIMEENRNQQGPLLIKKGNKEDDESRIDLMVEDLRKLSRKIPLSPAFLGETIIYPRKTRGLRFGSDKLPNLVELRDEVNRFTEQQQLINPRKKIKKLLKKYPNYADLRALNAIQIFNDAAQSGLSEKKLDVLEIALVEMAKALHNDAVSIFNATWFIKIYLKYLEFLKERLTHDHSAIANHYHRKVRRVAEELHKNIIQVTSLISIKDKLGGIMMLNAKLKGAVYISSCITQEELKMACAALKQDETKTVGVGKTANYVIFVIITLGLLFARVPVLENLVRELLTGMLDTSKDLILQKHMIGTMIRVTDLQLALASGDSAHSKEKAEKLFKRCLQIIGQHLEHTTLSKPHEVDPFLKAAWVVKESQGLFEKAEYKKMVMRSLTLLQKVLKNPGQVKGSYDLARQLSSEIREIAAHYGWEE